MDEPFLAGEDEAAAALGPRLLDEGAHQQGRGAPAAHFRKHAEAENRLPGALRVVQGGVLEHRIGDRRVVRHHAVDETNGTAVLAQKHEALGKDLHASLEALARGLLLGREGLRFDVGHGVKVAHRGGADGQHGIFLRVFRTRHIIGACRPFPIRCA